MAILIIIVVAIVFVTSTLVREESQYKKGYEPEEVIDSNYTHYKKVSCYKCTIGDVHLEQVYTDGKKVCLQGYCDVCGAEHSITYEEN